MSKTYLNYPFDDDLFIARWLAEPDSEKTALLDSGVMVEDPVLASRLISSGNYGTIPFYKTLTGTPVNHDGQTDITSTETQADQQNYVAYGRDVAWTARDFVGELSGADPMGHIISSTAKFWAKYRQKKIIAILGAIFGITGNAAWTAHTVDVGSATATARKINETDLNDLATDTLGDNKDAYKLAIMHSSVARTLENLQVLDYWKQTDANGIQRNLGLASVNGYTVIIDDGVPATAVGGLAMLKGLAGPMADLKVCPTGGITEDTAAEFLSQPNVVCIGGSWMVPKNWLKAGEWDKVEASAAKAAAIVAGVRAR